MGLDITAYRRLTKLDTITDDTADPYGACDLWVHPACYDWAEGAFPGRAAGLERGGTYKAEDRLSFRAGSYSGYGEWRDWLKGLAGYQRGGDSWPTSGPFAELINFADNEGYIGPAVAAKLAKDFQDNRDRMEREFGDDWYATKYREWQAAFELAADGGAVAFH